VSDLPPRTNQDSRDAIAAAWTARAYESGRCESFGEIVVPVATGHEQVRGSWNKS
jgi:hypothetical protein